MQRLRASLEDLNEDLARLDEVIGNSTSSLKQELAKQNERANSLRSREANVLALAQKIAQRLDHTIARVEKTLRD